ncbi:MAG: hypothetical protein IT207_01375 [Fimbriimonadaceae bacterium]|nr:hypothetical protein [Fimbriimonadaceae bacterium]
MRALVTAFALAIAALSVAQLPPGLTFDDGFTWLECHNFESVENNVLKGEWVLESSVRIWGTVPDRSGFKFTLKKDGKILAENMVDGYPVKFGNVDQGGLVILNHWKDAQRTGASGPMTVDVTYIDGASGKEYLAKTLKIDVRRIERTRSSVGKREPYAPAFIMNRHAEVLSSILYFREYENPSYTQLNGLSWFSERRLEILVNYAEDSAMTGIALGRIAVEVNGQPIQLRVPEINQPVDEMNMGELAGKTSAEHSDRDAAKYFNAGPYYRERISFVRKSFVLPLQWGPPLEGRVKSSVFTNDHPGDWKVTWLIDRKPVRIWRFKVGVDGLPIPHPEQTAGLHLAKNAVLVDTEIPGQGGEFDARLTPSFVKEGAFYGRPWTTAAMKEAASHVPTKGRPFPVSSAKQ